MTLRISFLLLLTINYVDVFGQNNQDSLYVFVGQKISIKKLPRPSTSDSIILISYPNYEAKYKIVQNVYGDYKSNTIKFDVNDHMAILAFSKTKFVLLFVYKHGSKFHQVRYQYFDVYKTTNGRWASPGNPFYLDEKYKDSIKTKIKAVKLDFTKPVTFRINLSRDSATIKEVFTEPYFKVEGQIATGLIGCYVEDLFIVKKEGILKELGYFK